jgi:hypothetical protein
MAAGVGTRPIVAVFGSSQPRRGDELYKSSLLMGALLGRYGFDVVTGGYKGVMEAVSRGAHGNGAHVVGVTMARFADRVNRYVMDEIRADNFAERFRWLVDRADAYVAMGAVSVRSSRSPSPGRSFNSGCCRKDRWSWLVRAGGRYSSVSPSNSFPVAGSSSR